MRPFFIAFGLVFLSGVFSFSALAFSLPKADKNNFLEYRFTENHQNTEIHVPSSFDAVSVVSSFEVSLSFDNGKTWNLLHPSDDLDGVSELFITKETASSFQYKTLDPSPVFQFFTLSSSPKYFAGTVETNIGYTRDEEFFQSLGIVKRENWGADESLRFVVPTPIPEPTVAPTATPWVPTPKPSLQDIQCDAWQAAAPEDFKTSASVFFESEKKLAWPHRYSPQIKKIILHHTAENVESLSSRTEEQTMQAIYKYHAKNKKWGDIGYHFVVAPSGKIYEGKAGGDYVVAGHAYCANAQTIGVSLMGNFENGNPSVLQMQSLERLLSGLSKKYSIDISASSAFHGEISSNLVGHKDYGFTACPGKFLYALLPSLRTHSVDYSALQGTSVFDKTVVKEILKAKISGEKIIRQLAKVSTMPSQTVFFENKGNMPWKQGEIVLQIKKAGIVKTVLMNELLVPVGQKASFSVTAFENVQARQNYTLTLKKNTKNISGGRAKWKLSPLTEPLSTPQISNISSSSSDNIRIALSVPLGDMRFSADDLLVDIDGKEISGGLSLGVSGSGSKILVNTQIEADVVRVKSANAGIVTIDSWQRVPEWNASLNDNMFRGVLEIRMVDGILTVINELPLEWYLKGLAEVSNSAPAEKQKAMAVIARSYARFYMLSENRKYPTKPYDGDDSPESFQKYLGYGYEKRSPSFASAVESTNNQVVMFQGQLVKTPYFSESDGRTRSAKEVWGWTTTPYLKAVDDVACKNGLGTLQGHGVGLSGCGAESMALQGFLYEDILKYYYTGVEVRAFEK